MQTLQLRIKQLKQEYENKPRSKKAEDDDQIITVLEHASATPRSSATAHA
jgi:hypothetical protein